MSTNFPASVDIYTNPSPTDTLDSVSVPHAGQHDNLNDAMTAVQTYALANGLLTGSGVPGAGLGVNTNLYLDTASGIIYRKTAGTWAAIYTPSGGGGTPLAVQVAGNTLYTVPGVSFAGAGTTFAIGAPSGTVLAYFPFFVQNASVTFDRVGWNVTIAGSGLQRVAIYNANTSWQPSTLVEDFGTASVAGTGVGTYTPAASTRTLPTGRYLFALNTNIAVTYRALSGTIPGGIIDPLFNGNAQGQDFTKFPVSFAAFPGSGAAWTAWDNTSPVGLYPFALRLTATA